MTEPRARRRPDQGPRIAAAGAILALGLSLYLPALGVEILRHPLEAKYALAAREMLRGGSLLVAHLFGGLYPDKPPLFFWATAGLGWLGGGAIGEVTARLPAVAGALVALLVTCRLGTDLFGPPAGFLAAVVLATSNLFFWYARQGHPDQFLTAFVALACLGFWRRWHAATRPGRAGWTAVAYGAMALGVLSKGLLGLVLPLLAGLAFLGATGPVRAIPARLGLASGLSLFLALTLAWFAPAVAQNGTAYLYETVVHQHVVRYARTWAHPAPWYYYLGEFPTGFFPWVLFLPGAIALGWRARADPGRAPEGASGGGAPGVRSFLFPLGWLLAGFVFFSLASGKRGAYLLPLYPAAALMVGWLLAETLTRRQRTAWVTVPVGGMSAVASLLALGLVTVPRRLIPGRMVDTLVPGEPRQAVTLAAVLLLGAALVWLTWRGGRPAWALGVLVTVQGVLLLAVATVRAPQYERRYPVRDLARQVHAVVPPGTPVFSLLQDYDFLVAFYTDRPLVPLPEAAALRAAQAAEPRYALVDNDNQAVLGEPGVRALLETRLGPKRVVLIRLDPAPR